MIWVHKFFVRELLWGYPCRLLCKILKNLMSSLEASKKRFCFRLVFLEPQYLRGMFETLILRLLLLLTCPDLKEKLSGLYGNRRTNLLSGAPPLEPRSGKST